MSGSCERLRVQSLLTDTPVTWSGATRNDRYLCVGTLTRRGGKSLMRMHQTKAPARYIQVNASGKKE